MKKIYSLATKISKVDATCIITGETGVGKTLLAKHMHLSSPRKDKPFISVNCASLPSELIESELFGYSKGAFTGAGHAGKKGLVSMADGGTLRCAIGRGYSIRFTGRIRFAGGVRLAAGGSFRCSPGFTGAMRYGAGSGYSGSVGFRMRRGVRNPAAFGMG